MFNFPNQHNGKHNDSITTFILTLTAVLMTWEVCSSCCFPFLSDHLSVVGVMWPRPGLHTYWDWATAETVTLPPAQHTIIIINTSRAGQGQPGKQGKPLRVFIKILIILIINYVLPSFHVSVLSSLRSVTSFCFYCLMFKVYMNWCDGHLNVDRQEFPEFPIAILLFELISRPVYGRHWLWAGAGD